MRAYPGGPWGTLYPYRANCSDGMVCAIGLKQFTPATWVPPEPCLSATEPGNPGLLHFLLSAREYQSTYYPIFTPGGGLDPLGTGGGGLVRSWFVRWNPVTGATSLALLDTAAKALHPLTGNSSGVLARREDGGGLLWIPWGGRASVSLRKAMCLARPI